MKSSFRYWANLIALTGFAQLMVQAIGLISGILVIRMLPVHEYALYTLANTMLGTMTILADGGVATGVMAEARTVWRDRVKLGRVLATGMFLRKKLAIFSLIFAVPVLVFLLQKHNASWLVTVLIVLSLIPAFFSNLSGSLLTIPFKLHQNIKPLQSLQVEANLLRLVLLFLSMLLFPFTAAALICAGLGQGWNNWRLRKKSDNYFEALQTVDLEIRHRIVGVVGRVMPSAVYYSLSSQITIWMLSFFGSTQDVAKIGALGRFSVVFILVGSMFSLLITPRYARFSGSKIALFNKYIFVNFMFIPLIFILMAPFWLYPDFFLLILGAEYMGLRFEIIMVVFGSLISTLSGSVYALNSARGYILSPYMFFPIFMSYEVLLLFTLPVSTLQGAITFSIGTGIGAYLLHFSYGLYKIFLEVRGLK